MTSPLRNPTIFIQICLFAGGGTLLLLAATTHSAGFEGLSGGYCANRRDSCCDGRIDECSVPVFDTLCYCDNFCNRSRHDDCCPDYWSHCLGVKPIHPEEQSRCYANGRYYSFGEETKVNCNKCVCRSQQGNGLEMSCETNACLIDEAVINSVNAHPELGWVAGNQSLFWGRTLADGIKYRTGTLEPHNPVKSMMPVVMKDPHDLPRTFDARIRWPGLVADPIDQGWCGASWAVSTVSVASDRFGIMSRGMYKIRLSAQHLLDCNKRGQQGCQGGRASVAWMFMRKAGLVDEDCYPWKEGIQQKCTIPRKSTLQSARCAPLPGQDLRSELYKMGPAYRIKGEHDIMHEIMASGPVQATMKVYQDLFSYVGGVYKKSFAGATNIYNYHSVKIIGWGEEIDASNGQLLKYWLAVNSWGPYWGERGLFRIVRGVNECDIEEFVVAAWSKDLRPNDRTETPSMANSIPLNFK